MEPTSNNLPPSHHLLLQLGLLVSLDKEKGQQPQLLVYRQSTDVKVRDQSKSVFESWTSGEDWYNWISWQQPGLLGLPTLLAKTINELKSEFNQVKPGDPNLKMTISELEVAESGLDHLREFNLDVPTQKIIAGALKDIQKLNQDFKKKFEGIPERKISNPESFYSPPSTGFSYYIPQKLASRFESAETKNMREAFEVVEKLKKTFKDDESLSPTLLKNLQFIMGGDNLSGQNLKKYVISCLNMNGSAFKFNPVDEPKLSEMGFTESECTEIKNFTYQLAEKTFSSNPETTKTLLKLYQLSDNHFEVKPQYVDSLNIVFNENEKIKNQCITFIDSSLNYKNLKETDLKDQVAIENSRAKMIDEYIVLEKLFKEDELSTSITFKDVKEISQMFIPIDLLLSRFNAFIDLSYADYFYDENNEMNIHTLASLNTLEGRLEFVKFLESYQELKEPLLIDLNNQEMREWMKSNLSKILKQGIEEYVNLPESQERKTLHQFEADITRGQGMLREDSYTGIHDLSQIPKPLSNDSTDEDKDNLIPVGYNAIKELCVPPNTHNQSFIPIIQAVTTQSSLNPAFDPTIPRLMMTGTSKSFENGVDTFNWMPSLSKGSRDIKIQIIRNPENQDIEKVKVIVRGSIDIVEQKMTNKSDDYINQIVVKDVIVADLSYEVSLDEKGDPLLSNFSLNYELSLK